MIGGERHVCVTRGYRLESSHWIHFGKCNDDAGVLLSIASLVTPSNVPPGNHFLIRVMVFAPLVCGCGRGPRFFDVIMSAGW